MQCRHGYNLELVEGRTSTIMRFIGTFLVALLLVVSGTAAQQYTAKSLWIDHAFARATPPGARTGGVYLTIENKSSDGDRLVRATSPMAESVELHRMSMDNGMMRMRALPGLDIPPGSVVAFESAGYHLMLLDLKRALKEGESFPM